MENNQLEEHNLNFVNRMETFVHQKAFPEILRNAEERLLRLPADVAARFFINLALIEMDRIEESRKILHELEKDIIRLSLGYLRAADAYREKGLGQDAVMCYQKFLSLNPLSEKSKEVAERITLLQKDEDIADEIDETESTNNQTPEFYTLTLADLYIQQDHPKMAADILAKIIEREPSNVQARVKLDTLKAAFALKSSSDSGNATVSTDYLINTLSCWLENISRLKKNAM